MPPKDLAIVILAAGKGTRLKSNLAKVLHQAGGRTLVEQVLRSCAPLGAKKTVVVIGHQAEQVAAVVEPTGASTVLQFPQHGTGHAMQVARRGVGGAKIVVVMPGDAPLVRTETLRALIAAHRAGNAAATILSAVVSDPSGLRARGAQIRNAGWRRRRRVTAHRSAARHQRDQLEHLLFRARQALAVWRSRRSKPNNKHKEIYLTDAIAVLAAKGETVLAQVAPDPREVLGCNTRVDLAEVDGIFREWKRNELMAGGVSIQLPQTVVVDSDVVAGEDTLIEANVQLLGKTKIGARCIVRTGSVLKNVILGDDVIVEPHCVMANSRLDERVTVGPFARLRPDNHVKAGAHIGNFVELKKTTMGEGAKAGHLSYLGTRRSAPRPTSAQARSLATTMDFTNTRRSSAIAFSSAAIPRWWRRYALAAARTLPPDRSSRTTFLPMRSPSRAAAKRTSPAGPAKNAANFRRQRRVPRNLHASREPARNERNAVSSVRLRSETL